MACLTSVHAHSESGKTGLVCSTVTCETLLPLQHRQLVAKVVTQNILAGGSSSWRGEGGCWRGRLVSAMGALLPASLQTVDGRPSCKPTRYICQLSLVEEWGSFTPPYILDLDSLKAR